MQGAQQAHLDRFRVGSQPRKKQRPQHISVQVHRKDPLQVNCPLAVACFRVAKIGEQLMDSGLTAS
jgi:hypothetical protein